MSILKHHGKRTPEVVFFDFVYVYAVIPYFSVRNVIKTVYKISYGRFSCACRTDESDFLTWLSVKAYPIEYGMIFFISENNIIKFNIASDFGIGD